MVLRKITLLLLSLTFSFQAFARNDVLMVDVEAAMATPAAHKQLDNGVRFYFGKTQHPEVVKNIADVKTSKKTNALNKSDIEACQWVFLSAMLELQASAVRQGGDAVVDIQSNYQNNPVSSETQFQCGAGFMMSGVALKGTVVKLAD